MSTIAQNIAVQNVNRSLIVPVSAEKGQGDLASRFKTLPMQSSLFFAQKTGFARSASNDVWHGSITILGPLM